jgi:hypothetical protein
MLVFGFELIEHAGFSYLGFFDGFYVDSRIFGLVEQILIFLVWTYVALGFFIFVWY